jgi:NAD(P)-dependent dehydrogenase (short-subunit alcohol dehydrogenase family)
MVIVLTSPLAKTGSAVEGRRGSGLGVEVALAAAAAGARVELVGKVGDDEAGDGIAVELERAGVGHAALLRDPSSATPVEGRDAPLSLGRADVELALRYLVDFRVVITTDPLSADAGEVVAEAAGYAGAHRIIVGSAGSGGDDLTILIPPGADGEGATAFGAFAGFAAFAAFVGRYAALLDAGRPPSDAFAAAAAEVGWEPARHA